jgi:hypothetical protein
MATRRYGVSRGESPEQVVEGVGSATSADSVELTVDLAANLSMEDVILALEKIGRKIMQGNWPPA